MTAVAGVVARLVVPMWARSAEKIAVQLNALLEKQIVGLSERTMAQPGAILRKPMAEVIATTAARKGVALKTC